LLRVPRGGNLKKKSLGKKRKNAGFECQTGGGGNSTKIRESTKKIQEKFANPLGETIRRGGMKKEKAPNYKKKKGGTKEELSATRTKILDEETKY